MRGETESLRGGLPHSTPRCTRRDVPPDPVARSQIPRTRRPAMGAYCFSPAPAAHRGPRSPHHVQRRCICPWGLLPSGALLASFRPNIFTSPGICCAEPHTLERLGPRTAWNRSPMRPSRKSESFSYPLAAFDARRLRHGRRISGVLTMSSWGT